MPTGDWDKTTTSVAFSEIHALLYEGTTTVRALRVLYKIVHPSGVMDDRVLTVDVPPDVQSTIQGSSDLVVMAVFAYEGLETIYIPTPPAPPPPPQIVESSRRDDEPIARRPSSLIEP